ncbi:MAG: hypothetical protein IJ867_03655 [Clostridia bacterium]|nr:hypothetical protein [Clostridia bacterium]
MNQILDFGVGGGNDNNNNRKEKKQPKKQEKYEYDRGGDFGGGNNTAIKTPMSDKVVKVFAILMVILAVFLIFSGVTSIMRNNEDKTANASNSQTVAPVQAEILAELDDILGRVTITVNSEITIDQMKYSWDKDHDNIVSGKKQTSLEEVINVPYGEHVLHVTVTDDQKNTTTKEFTFDSATGIDTTSPEIKLVASGSKLQVTATDDTSIAYVTYTWNEDGETVTMTPEEEGLQEYEFEIDIPMGTNTIVVWAVDGSDGANAKTVSKLIEAKTNPEISYGFMDNEGAVLKIMCSHENGIKSIYYTFNGQPYQWELADGDEAPKYLEFEQASVVGQNSMEIKVTSIDDTVKEFNPVWEYAGVQETPEEQPVSEQDDLQELQQEDQGTTNEGNTTEDTTN